VDGEGISGEHSAILLTKDLQAKLAAREADVKRDVAKPLFVYMVRATIPRRVSLRRVARTVLLRLTTAPSQAFHMIHMGDSNWPDGGPGKLSPAGDKLGQSVAGTKNPIKVLEAPIAYSLPFANITNVTRRVFVGMVSLVDEAIGNISRSWESTGHAKNGIIVMVCCYM